MSTREQRRRSWAAVAWACAAAAVLGASPAPAAEPDEIGIDRMRLAIERGGVLSVESGRVVPHLEAVGAAWLGYANDPLILHRLGDEGRVASLVGDRASGALAAGVGILDWAQLAIEVPVVLYQSPHAGAVTPPSVSGFGFGSIRLVPKVRLLEAGRHGLDLAVLAGVNVPLGAQDFVGSELALQPEVAASRAFGGMRLAANLGATIRDEATLRDVRLGNELSAQAGAAYDLKPRFGLPLEAGLLLAAAVSASDPFGRSDETSVEARAYGAVDVLPAVRLLAGGGLGIEPGWGTPDWRIFAGAQLGFPRRAPPAAAVTEEPTPVEVAAEPPAAPPEPPPLPAAPPPPPAEPPDADGDGLAAADDRCPAVPGPAENGGCPDQDRDGDGLVDRTDECPDLAGPADHRGCPPKAAVKLEGDRIEFEGTIYFALGSAVIEPRSSELLDGIAKVILAHPELARIRVEGHTDSQGGRAYNQTLSERRATSVAQALVARGVAADRLVAAGFGLDRPVATNATRAGRAKNRRVELHVEGAPAEGTN